MYSLLCGTATQIAIGLAAGIHHRDRHTGRLQGQGAVVGAVIVGEDHGLASGQDGVAPHVSRHGRGQHDARQIVVAKHQRAFVGTRGQHHLLGPYPPEPLSWGIPRLFEVIGTALGQRQVIVVLVAKDGGARQELYLGHGSQTTQGILGPSGRRHAVHLSIAGQQPAARLRLLISQDDPGAGGSGRQGSAEPRYAPSHNQYVAKRIAFFIMVGVCLTR